MLLLLILIIIVVATVTVVVVAGVLLCVAGWPLIAASVAVDHVISAVFYRLIVLRAPSAGATGRERRSSSE